MNGVEAIWVFFMLSARLHGGIATPPSSQKGCRRGGGVTSGPQNVFFIAEKHYPQKEPEMGEVSLHPEMSKIYFFYLLQYLQDSSSDVEAAAEVLEYRYLWQSEPHSNGY